MSHFEISGYFAGRLTLNNLDILSVILLWILSVFFSGDSQRMIWIFCRTSQGEISQNVSERFAINYLAIILGASRWIILIFCQVSQGELSCYFVRPFTIYNLDIFSESSWWIISICCRRSRKLSWYLTDVSRCSMSTSCRAFQSEISQCFAGRLAMDFPDISLDVSLWIITIFLQVPHSENSL